ncbi:MAG: MarR family transcriptional regulator [Patescibacteria group bacterium]
MKEINKIKEVTLETALLNLRRTMTDALKDQAVKLGQSVAHIEVLKFVFEAGDPTMKSLSEHLKITPPSTSALVEGLVEKGFLERIVNPKDRRTIRIKLTTKSHKLFVKLHKSKISIFNEILSRLNSEDKKQLAHLLTKCLSIKK